MSNFLPARRDAAQWRAALNHNQAVAQVSSLDGAIQIYKGRFFWPMVPDHPGNDFDIETIAHTLATIPRWGGQTADLWGDPLRFSVAQHSVITSVVAERAYADALPKWDWECSPGTPGLYALFHDATEGYGFCDLTRPVKYSFPGYKEGEHALMEHIIKVLNIPIGPAIRECVRRIDNMMVFLERDVLMDPPVVPYSNEADHPRIKMEDVWPDFEVWDAATAKRKFIERYNELTKEAA